MRSKRSPAPVGDANAGNLMVLCRSAIEGINADDRKLLIRLSADNGRPVIIQGRLIQEAIDAGAGVFGLLQARPFDRIFQPQAHDHPRWAAHLGRGAPLAHGGAAAPAPRSRNPRRHAP